MPANDNVLQTVDQALSCALDMLCAIYDGQTFSRTVYERKVIAMERALDSSLDSDHLAMVRFLTRKPLHWDSVQS